MKVTVDSKKGLKSNLKVFVDRKTIEEKIQTRLNELSKTVNLKGFRPGKVPPAVLKKQFGKAIYGEVLEKILQETSVKALQEKKIKAAGQPKLDLKSHGEGKDLNYTLEVDELPSVKLQSIENINFTDYEIKTEEEEIWKRIKDIAKSQDNFIDKGDNDIAKDGDLVAFDYNATIDNQSFEGGEGKNTQIILGKDLFIKGFDKHLLGVKKDDEKEITATLPENYPKKEFARKNANFKCKVLNIKKPEPVQIDDQFAKNLGAKDLNDLKNMVNKQIQDQYKSNLDALSRDKILNQIEKMHDIDLPDSLVQQEIALISQSLKKEDMEKNKKESEKIAKKRKLGLILNEIGEKNNLRVEEEEVKNEVQKQVQSMPGQQKQILEYYQKNPSAAASLKGSIYEDKIISLIKQKAKKIKKIISIKEAEEIIKNDYENKKISSGSAKNDHQIKTKKTPKKAKKGKKIRKK